MPDLKLHNAASHKRDHLSGAPHFPCHCIVQRYTATLITKQLDPFTTGDIDEPILCKHASVKSNAAGKDRTITSANTHLHILATAGSKAAVGIETRSDKEPGTTLISGFRYMPRHPHFSDQIRSYH